MIVENPTVEEVKAWPTLIAIGLILNGIFFCHGREKLIYLSNWQRITSAPKKSFFLHMLYCMVGKTYKDKNEMDFLGLIKSYVNKTNGMRHGDIKAWRLNVANLLRGSLEYNYDDWNCGRLANYKIT